MALQTYPTFTPSAYLAMVAPPVTPSDPTGATIPYIQRANTVALPAGTSPDKVLIQNLGPDVAVVLLTTAAATTTGTAAVGATVVTVASATSIAVGQAIVGAGVPEGTVVTALSGTSVTISRALTAALSSTALNFVVPVTLSTGIAVQPGAGGLIALAYGSNTFISAICNNGSGRSVLNVAVGV